MKFTILVIDGQGGNLGCQLIKLMKEQLPDAEIRAVGTNSSATANMLKAGGIAGATGENAVIVGCRKADIIVGPVGIVIADALMGEITPEMAKAIGQSSAKRVLVPVNLERKGRSFMARKTNYTEKIAALEAKIAKKQDELKKLKQQLSELKAKKASEDYQELTEYMQANNLTASEVLASIKG